jgi:hypothetical protein
MSNKSRRIKLAAGAILAGAAIPIAAAGTAWADTTENQQQLENQGFSSSEAQAIVNAEAPGGTAVQVSYDGKIVVDANQPGIAGMDATATSARNDVSAAIGGGSDSTSHGAGAVALSDGTNDDAIAHGKDASVQIYDDGGTGDTTATARGSRADAYADGDSSVKETAHGSNAYVDAEEATNTTLTATGKGAEADADNDVSNSTVTAHGTRAYADAYENDDNVKVTATGKATDAYAYDSSDGSATAKDTALRGGEPRPVAFDALRAVGGDSGFAEIDYTTNSEATARGHGSIAEVLGAYGSPVDSSSAVDTNGTATTVYTSDTHLENGMVADGHMFTPLLP